MQDEYVVVDLETTGLDPYKGCEIIEIGITEIVNNKIVKKHLILCEGRDAEEFLITYLNCNELLSIPEFSNEFQVMDFGGILNLSNYNLYWSSQKYGGFSLCRIHIGY